MDQENRSESTKRINGTGSDPIIRQLVRWAERRASVRAVLLTSTRTHPGVTVDLFSDYDVILVVTDIRPFFEDRAWLGDFGEVLVVYRDPIKIEYGGPRFAYITQYEQGTKIDFTLWSVDIPPQIAREPELPDELDVGYLVLLDKEGLCDGFKPPTFTAYIPSPPTEASYHNLIEEFFHEATYVAKHLWRGDLMAAKYNLDQMMKLDNLRVMLEWLIETEHNWSLKPGACGKGLQKHLPPELGRELEATYVGPGTRENWDALFRTIALFRRVAIQVGDCLGHAYLDDLDRRVVAYLHKVENLDPEAESLWGPLRE